MRVVIACIAMTAPAALAQPSNCRFYIAGQYDFGGRLGFYLDFEGTELVRLPLILGVADGTNWRFLSHAPGFAPDRDYTIRVVLAPDRAELWVDGERVGSSPGTWRAAPVPLEANQRPSWATERGDWIAIVSKLVVSVERNGTTADRREFDFGDIAARPVALQLVEEGRPSSGPLETRDGDTLTIEVTLRFGDADLTRYAPFIDRYGQYRYADFPGKVRSDDDLRADIASEDDRLEAMPPPDDRDEYGGVTGFWTEAPTGFFRVVQRDGVWWLISPRGNPCFLTGVSGPPAQLWEKTPTTGREFLFEWLPPRDGPYGVAWAADVWGEGQGTDYVCLHTANLIRKYGDDWQAKSSERTVRRLRAWGFVCGKWGAPVTEVQTPVLHLGATPRIDRHPDVFDDAILATMREELEKQIAPRRDDPRIVGWSVGNEYDEIITPAEVRAILAKPESAACGALVRHALEVLHAGSVAKLAEAWQVDAADLAGVLAGDPTVPDVDLEALRRVYADRYYRALYETIKGIDPNHLYLGNWIVPGWWVNEDDWRLVAPYCDVIGYDRYSVDYNDERLARLQREAGKPTLCGEFSMPPWYGGLRGFGRFHSAAEDEAQAGELYNEWTRAAARDPYCVGQIWFMYRDQALTGRGPGRGPQLVHGEHFAFGLITETDRAKWPMVERMREANLAAVRWRMAAPGP